MTLKLKKTNTDIIAELTTEKNKAIEDLDFEKAERVYNEIQKEISRRSIDSFAQILLRLSDSVQNLEEKYRNEILNYSSKYQTEQKQLKEDYSTNLTRIQKEKESKIEELEQSKQYKLTNLSLDLTEYNEIITKAKYEASKANFRAAKELKAEALTVKQRETEKASGDVLYELEASTKEAEDTYNTNLNSLKLRHLQNLYNSRHKFEETCRQMKNDCLSEMRTIYHKAEANVQALTASDKEKSDMQEKIHQRFEEDVTRISSYNPPEESAPRAEKENSAQPAKQSFFVTAPRPMTARSPKRKKLNETGGIIDKTLTPDFTFSKQIIRMSNTAKTGTRSPRNPRIVTPKSVFF